MLVTKRKLLRSEFERIADYLPVWRFVQLRCFACGHATASALVPYDLDDYPRNGSHCSECGKMRCAVVAILPDMSSLPLLDAKREWGLRKGQGWEPEFYSMLRARNCG